MKYDPVFGLAAMKPAEAPWAECATGVDWDAWDPEEEAAKKQVRDEMASRRA